MAEPADVSQHVAGYPYVIELLLAVRSQLVVAAILVDAGVLVHCEPNLLAWTHT